MASGTFGTAVNCMDGRVQAPVAEWVRARYPVQYVDAVTEAGPDGILANGPAQLIESIRQRVLVSVEKHGSPVIVIAGHHDCAGNPVSKEQHALDIQRAMQVIASWNLPVHIIGLWVNEAGGVEVVGELRRQGA